MSYYQSHLQQEHFEEWVTGSGVDEFIVVSNVRSLSSPEDIADLLNRNPKTRAQIKGVLATPGWAVAGVDPETGNQTWEGAQFKPDTPIQRYKDGSPQFKKDGSPDYQKYFSASGCETAPLFLNPGKNNFWLDVKNDITQRIILAEGAKKAGSALTAGEACISLPGVTNGQRKGRLKKSLERFCEPGRVMVLGFDSDMFHNPNVCKALNKLGCLLLGHGVIVRVLVLPRETKGIDDFVVAHGHEAFKQLIDNAMTFEEWRDEYVVNAKKEVKTTDIDAPAAEENYQLKAQAALFSSTPWVSINGNLHCWTGTHYKLQDEAEVKAIISRWCSAAAVYSGGSWTRSYATATHIDNIYAWVQRHFAIAPSKVNPPGLNCLNGVVTISWHGKQPRWELKKHDPATIYTYVGEFEYNPAADSTVCDQLLQCLEPPQREIFIKTMAASLDLKQIREFKGRAIKALLCKGDGNNGKDSLREAVFWLYGIGVVDCPVEDFWLYQQGKKYYLAKLEHARVSWSSENANLAQLDNNQALKKVITGEAIDVERKFQIDYPLHPSTVLLFNINSVPNLQASMEAIKSRYAVLSFDKTFKAGADPVKGELEADSRFRYDPEFIKKEVVPSLLNKMLAALGDVAMNGIDYSCTDESLQEIQQENNHLRRFAREVGLGEMASGRVYINDLWEKLREWYIANGTLVITADGKGKEKQEWHDQPKKNDRNVKAPNQVYQRFAEIFPQVRRERDTSNLDRKGQFYLSGLSFGNPGEILQPLPEDDSVLKQIMYLLQKLRPDEQEVLRKTLNAENKVDELLHLASPSDDVRATASPTASPTASLASLSDSPVSQTDSTGTIVSIGQSRDLVADHSTKNFSATSHPDFKIGDRVLIDFPSSKRHGKVGEIIRLKTWQGLSLADVKLPGESRCFEAQIVWLRPAPLEGEQKNLPLV